MSKNNTKTDTPVGETNVVIEVNPVTEQFSGILNTLSSFRSSITMLQTQVRALEKNVNKQMKNSEIKFGPLPGNFPSIRMYDGR